MTWQNQFLDLVSLRYAELKKQHPAFSVRKYAKLAKLSPGAMSQLLNRKPSWALMPDRSLDIVDNVFGGDERFRHFAAVVGKEVKIHRETIKGDDYDILTDWVYLPVLHSFDLTQRPTVEQLAKKLTVPEQKIQDVISDLVRRGYLKTNDAGEIYRDKVYWETSDGPPNKAVRQHHRVGVELALKALEMPTNDEQDFNSMTFAGNTEQMSLIRAEIRKVFEKVTALAEGSETNNEVFRMSVQFFPFKFEKPEGNPQ